jgi:SAM-dependent methyltransferase
MATPENGSLRRRANQVCLISFFERMIVDRFKSWLAHPLTRELELDDPLTTQLRRQIIQSKPALREIYREWYEEIARSLPPGDEPVLEVGSGAGFLHHFIPGLITSEIFPSPEAQVVLDASSLPFADGVFRAIVLVDVLHHIPRPRDFFSQAARCVKVGGALVMIEPWVSAWSKVIYGKFHHEPFRPEAAQWEFPQGGPLSGANGALPWILFLRDRNQFEMEFPCWEIQLIRPGLPFRYLASGGVSMRSFLPAAGFDLLRWLENCLQPWMGSWAMFAQIILVRT